MFKIINIYNYYNYYKANITKILAKAYIQLGWFSKSNESKTVSILCMDINTLSKYYNKCWTGIQKIQKLLFYTILWFDFELRNN